MRLAKPAQNITVGAVLRASEEDFKLVECFGPSDACRITKVCRLKRVFQSALQAYLNELDRWTIAEVVARPKLLLDALAIDET